MSTDNFNTVTPRQLRQCLLEAIVAGTNVYVQSPPGLGKSSIVGQVAAEVGMHLCDIRTAQHDPVDFIGVPSIINVGADGIGRTVFHPPTLLPGPEHGPAIIFFDEFANAAPAIQTACLQVWWDRRLGQWEAVPGSVVVGAGNRVQDRAGSGRIISSLRSRAVMLELVPHVDDWIEWALENGLEIPVIAYIRGNPESLSDFDPAKDANADPRGWERVSRLLPHLSESTRLPMLSGIVGPGHATRFLGFLEVYGKLPDPDEIVMNPSGAPVPPEEEPAQLYAVAMGAARKASAHTAPALYTYADRLPPEFAGVMIHAAIDHDRDGMIAQNGRAYADFVTRHQSHFTGRA